MIGITDGVTGGVDAIINSSIFTSLVSNSFIFTFILVFAIMAIIFLFSGEFNPQIVVGVYLVILFGNLILRHHLESVCSMKTTLKKCPPELTINQQISGDLYQASPDNVPGTTEVDRDVTGSSETTQSTVQSTVVQVVPEVDTPIITSPIMYNISAPRNKGISDLVGTTADKSFIK